MDRLFTLGLLLAVAVFNSGEAFIDSGFGMAPRVLGGAMGAPASPQQLPATLNNLAGNVPQTQQTGGARAAMGRTSPVQPVDRPQPPSSFFPGYRYAYPRQQYYYYNPYRYWMYGMMDEFFD